MGTLNKRWKLKKPFSIEHRQKLSDAKKGKAPWNKGVFGIVKQTKETIEKRRIKLLGHPVSIETREKIAFAQRGEKSYNWKGGKKHKDKYGMHTDYKYKYNGNGQKALKIDNFSCIKCGNKNDLVVHHFNKNKQDNRVENLITLCRQCHSSLHLKQRDAGKQSNPNRLSDGLAICGTYLFTLTNALTGQINKRFFYTNLITNAGLTLIANNLTDPTPDNDMLINYAALGTDATAVALADTTLGTETYRNAIASLTNSANIAYATAYYNQTECNGTYKEAGIFCDGGAGADTGILLSHVNIDITKSLTEKLTVDWTLTLANA